MPLKLIQKCKQQLKKFKQPTRICRICFEDIRLNSLSQIFHKNLCICEKCFNEFNPEFKSFRIGSVNYLALYPYDDYIKSKIYQLKGCYDIELAPTFLDHYLTLLKIRYYGYTVIPIPSNKEDDAIRGFNHVREIYKTMNLDMLEAITKSVKFKQSDLNHEERKNVSSKLALMPNVDIRKKKILLVDDIMTTGETIKACIALLKPLKPKTIKVLVIAYNQKHAITSAKKKTCDFSKRVAN